MAYEPFGGASSVIDGDSGNTSADVSDTGALSAFFLGGSEPAGSGSDSGDVDAAGTRFDPDVHVALDKRNADGSYRRKRGRKSTASGDSGRKARKDTNYSASIDSLTRVLTFVHLGIASATKTPELVIDEAEARTLSEATANVLREFDIRPDPKVEAIIGLITACGVVYGPKVYFIRERKKAEKEAR